MSCYLGRAIDVGSWGGGGGCTMCRCDRKAIDTFCQRSFSNLNSRAKKKEDNKKIIHNLVDCSLVFLSSTSSCNDILPAKENGDFQVNFVSLRSVHAVSYSS